MTGQFDGHFNLFLTGVADPTKPFYANKDFFFHFLLLSNVILLSIIFLNKTNTPAYQQKSDNKIFLYERQWSLCIFRDTIPKPEHVYPCLNFLHPLKQGLLFLFKYLREHPEHSWNYFNKQKLWWHTLFDVRDTTLTQIVASFNLLYLFKSIKL
jgi:hypothetical protein